MAGENQVSGNQYSVIGVFLFHNFERMHGFLVFFSGNRGVADTVSEKSGFFFVHEQSTYT